MAKKSSNKTKVAKSKVVAKGKAGAAKKAGVVAKKAPSAKKKSAPAKVSKAANHKAKSKPAASKSKSVKPTAKKVAAKLTGKKPVTKKPVKPVAKTTPSKNSAKPITVGKAKVVAEKVQSSKAKVTSKANGHSTKKPEVVAKVAKEPINRISDVKSQLAADDLARFKAILMQKRSRLRGDVAMMSEEALGGEDGAVDNHAPIHPAEVGSHSFEQEFTLDLLSHDGDRIQMIEMALEKLDEGTYGQCDECGARIPKGRLEMLPESIFCVKCATRIEGSRF